MCLCRCVALFVCVSPTPLHAFFVCKHACLHKSVLHLSVSSTFFPLSVLSLVLTTASNRLKRQASAAVGREEAGKLMIPHHHSDKRQDMFPPQKQHTKKTQPPMLDYLFILSLNRSFSPPCVLYAILPSP